MAKKGPAVTRTRMTDEQADHFAARHEKEADLRGKEATNYWRRYGARRLAALQRDQKKHEAKPRKAAGKAKHKAKKAA